MSKESIDKKGANIKEKGVYTEDITDWQMKDFFAIDKNLKEELEQKGLAHHWLNATLMKKNYGFHRTGWKPYKRESKPPASVALDFGDAGDGYVRRGDMILGVMPKEIHQRHIDKNKAKREANKQYNQKAAQGIRQSMGSLDAKIEAGYEEDGEF